MQPNNPNMFYQNQMQGLQTYPQTQQIYQPPVQQEYYTGANGEASALNYAIAPGSTVWLIDSAHMTAYCKSRDFQGGMSPMEEYDLVKRVKPEETVKADEANDIEELRKEVKSLAEVIASMKPIIEELKL